MVLDEPALIAALRGGRLGGAAPDATCTEPPATRKPDLGENRARFLDGQPLIHLLDRQRGY